MTPAEIRELIERLQAYYDSDPSDIYEKAAAAIEQQAARIVRFEAALIQISLGGDDPAGIAMDVLKWGDLASSDNGD